MLRSSQSGSNCRGGRAQQSEGNQQVLTEENRYSLMLCVPEWKTLPWHSTVVVRLSSSVLEPETAPIQRHTSWKTVGLVLMLRGRDECNCNDESRSPGRQSVCEHSHQAASIEIRAGTVGGGGVEGGKGAAAQHNMPAHPAKATTNGATGAKSKHMISS